MVRDDEEDKFDEKNHLEIMQAERELGKIYDSELRDKLQELKIFEILQAKKFNAHFLDIAKKASCVEKLTDFCDSDGKVLLSATELGNYITHFVPHCLGLTRTCKVRFKIFLGPKSANTHRSEVVC